MAEKSHSAFWAVAGVVGVVALWSYKQRKCPPALFVRDSLPFGFNAITLPPIGVFVKKKHLGNKRLMIHELAHWQQYQRMGLIGFYYKYFSELAVDGYDGSGMEREARRAAGECDGCVNSYTDCVRNGFACTVNDPNFRR